jgi:hypothetical protein
MSATAPRTEKAPAAPARYSVAHFQYQGSSALTVLGPISGTRYRFSAPGATLAVDLRDRAALAQIPQLRQVLGITR